MAYAYVVNQAFEWKNQTLNRGSVLYDDDARELEKMDNTHKLHQCSRIPEEILELAKPEAAPPEAVFSFPDIHKDEE